MVDRPYSGIVSPEATRDLLKVREALEGYGPTARARFEDAAANQLRAGFTEEIDRRPGFNAFQKEIVGAVPLVGVSGFTVIAQVGGVGPLGHLTRAWEFGTVDRDRAGQSLYPLRNGRRRAGLYTRRTQRQVPPRSTRGWIAYPAAGKWSERVYSMLMQILVKTGHDAFEGKGR